MGTPAQQQNIYQANIPFMLSLSSILFAQRQDIYQANLVCGSEYSYADRRKPFIRENNMRNSSRLL
ncbi:MAG: hypothetical protein LBG21_04040, partial [Campylobacteraceae bacterium]|nr:hypothetical protein [Campylobacteraceae bacterium]